MKSPLRRFPPIFLIGASLTFPAAAAQTTTRVSVDSGGLQADDQSHSPSITIDGRFVAFSSEASNLVPGDTNGYQDIFVHDRQTGQTTLVSVDSAGLQGNDNSMRPSISSDGRFVAFDSIASNLVPGDSNGRFDIFVHDRQTGLTTRVSVDSGGLQGNDSSLYSNLSADGSLVAFASSATNLVPGDTNAVMDVFVHDRRAGLTTRVSVDTAGLQGNGLCSGPSLSADGRFVAFQSSSDNLVPGDTNGSTDVFVHDRQTGQTIRASVDSAGIQGNWHSMVPWLSSDGRIVAFDSIATNLSPGDANQSRDVFVHDRQTGLTTRASVSSAGLPGDDQALARGISFDGRYVVMDSQATNLVLGDTNGTDDVFVHDRATGQTSLVSVTASGGQGNDLSWAARISGDGRFVAFHSEADNLVPGDTNATTDVFVHDRLSNAFALAAQGSCPGTITLTLTNATANGFVVLVSGPAGVFVKPTPPCQGITLGVSAPALRATLTADAAGGASLTFNAPAAACGLTLQAVDVAPCAASNAIML